jgi:hypothetical protein
MCPLEVVKNAPNALVKFAPSNTEAPTIEPRVEIRKRENGDVIATGLVVQPRSDRYFKFVRREEGKLWLILTLSFSLSLVLAAVSLTAHLAGKAKTSPWKATLGWSDRVSSAFGVACLTAAVNAWFEFKEWRNPATGPSGVWETTTKSKLGWPTPLVDKGACRLSTYHRWFACY